MNAYLWHVKEHGDVRHHLRAASTDEARERIAVTRGEEIARRAVIKSLQTNHTNRVTSAAA
jgi:hypothetical protein